MRDLAEALAMAHALLLLAAFSATVGAWAALLIAVPSIAVAGFLTCLAARDAARLP
ncbi:hypothetical protein J2847_004111 [Azospirillum agricola]|uniref:hypothetical protein n=1 Tax=Azospirillum agricola TaxID=1720247 RepID=UPI001AE85911|nr:hypothetical protein [Azospirillum agricola]MBP2230802.1 hypothetical protein [Azospirillum agricola]